MLQTGSQVILVFIPNPRSYYWWCSTQMLNLDKIINIGYVDSKWLLVLKKKIQNSWNLQPLKFLNLHFQLALYFTFIIIFCFRSACTYQTLILVVGMVPCYASINWSRISSIKKQKREGHCTRLWTYYFRNCTSLRFDYYQIPPNSLFFSKRKALRFTLLLPNISYLWI